MENPSELSDMCQFYITQPGYLCDVKTNPLDFSFEAGETFAEEARCFHSYALRGPQLNLGSNDQVRLTSRYSPPPPPTHPPQTDLVR